MASINFSLAAAVLLFGLLILGMAVESSEAVCTLMRAQGTYITCANIPGQNFTGCACGQCAPQGCAGCVVHLAGGSTPRG
ncbi:hypothetical protein GQ55_9G096800 [Panicum hallii var. hallii]|uniref:Uncharacterized protein n=1 Tax=Panicum hallii var. hallii TaxID=1504633 RepID=A0A2T7C1H5_9POAL|nr:hypothetical protein GQ55_9G096800 [Panicum hallii var. hallii]